MNLVIQKAFNSKTLCLVGKENINQMIYVLNINNDYTEFNSQISLAHNKIDL